MLACSGTEALEIALMTARVATAAAGIVCTDATYHGNSHEVAKMNRLPVGERRPGFRSMSTPQRFRPVVGDGPADPDDPGNHALNRRVEISVYPPESQ